MVGSLEAENMKLRSANVIRSQKFYAQRGMVRSNLADASQSIANVMYAIGFTLTEAQQVARMQEQVAWSLQRQFIHRINIRAAANHKAFHHVYEPNHIGETPYKLFNLLVDNQQYRSTMRMNLRYYPSKMMVPPTVTKGGARDGYSTKKRHRFPNKAMAFEYGRTLYIRPKNGNYLVFLSNNKSAKHKKYSGNTVFLGGPYRPTPLIVIRTKNYQTFGSLTKAAEQFFQERALITANKIYARQPKRMAVAGRLAAHRGLRLGIASDSAAKAIGKSASKEAGL